MGYLAKIRACNRHDLSVRVPFVVGGQTVGWVWREILPRLLSFDDVFSGSEAELTLAPGLDDPESRTAAVDRVLRRLHDEGVVVNWRDEPYAVTGDFGRPALMYMERAAAALFGIIAFGVHMNGIVRDGDGTKLWIARRSKHRIVAPGKLDNMVAGGQPATLGLVENLVKECAEEADIPAELARQARPAGMVSYAMDLPPGGLRRDVLYVYDLDVPADFAPRNTDGESESFHLMPLAEVARLVRDTDSFKFNCNLVIIDFLVRHGFIAPEEPDYLDIVTGLRR